jgi:RNA polymerase sigma factor (sigma-70 family)
MVLRVCGGLLRDPNDAEDAFQATFLVLARKARSLRVGDTIGPWLYGVAHRVATRALSDRARRHRHERAAAGRAAAAIEPDGPDDLGRVLHEEIGRLPAPFRAPIVLCYLEGLTHDQAAHQLGWPVGTVRSRLARGRDRLRRRLDEREAAPAIAPLLAASASAGRAGEAIRPSLAVATVRAAARMTTGMAAAGTVPAVVSLTEGVLRTMMLKTLFRIAATAAAAALLATGAVAYQASGPGQTTTAGTKPPPATRPAVPPKSEAETIAETFLKAGSDLFDAKNAAALAATYTEDGEILLVGKKDGQHDEGAKRGRAEIERFYSDIFAGDGAIDSENTVEFARLISPDILVVHGRFRPDTGKPEWPFVQMRVKQGDRWLMSKLWLFLTPGRQGDE